MKKSTLLTLTSNITTTTAKTCGLFILTTLLNQSLRDTTKNTSEEFAKVFRYLKNKYSY